MMSTKESPLPKINPNPTPAVESTPLKTEAIFIVGVSRSGTTLMRKILNSSRQIAICEENHFMGHLIASEGARHKFRKLGSLSNDENVYRLVDYLYSGEFENSSKKHRVMSFHWRWIINKVNREDFLQRILASDRSERALFQIMMQVFAERKGKPIMGEKTPAHVRYISTILNWFPKGRVIHMLRDPRAIFSSEFRRRQKRAVTTPYKQLKHFGPLFKFYIVLQTSIAWYESVWRYQGNKKRFPDNYYLLKFEDLVNTPEACIKQLCEFLGIEFQEEMLQQVVVSEGFQLGQSGFDSSAASRWQEQIDPWVNGWFRFWFGKYLKEFHYSD